MTANPNDVNQGAGLTACPVCATPVKPGAKFCPKCGAGLRATSEPAPPQAVPAKPVSATSAESPTGQRYIGHREKGSTILLFVREDKRRQGLALPYCFLGPADYLSHEGSRPMNIVWRLRHGLPAKLLRTTARLSNE